MDEIIVESVLLCCVHRVVLNITTWRSMLVRRIAQKCYSAIGKKGPQDYYFTISGQQQPQPLYLAYTASVLQTAHVICASVSMCVYFISRPTRRAAPLSAVPATSEGNSRLVRPPSRRDWIEPSTRHRLKDTWGPRRAGTVRHRSERLA